MRTPHRRRNALIDSLMEDNFAVVAAPPSADSKVVKNGYNPAVRVVELGVPKVRNQVYARAGRALIDIKQAQNGGR